MISVESVSKRWRRTQALALAGVTFQLQPGSVCALVGPNGAGKSTLLSLLLGFTLPSAGRITIRDAEPRDWVREHGAGYLPERFSLPGNWRVRMALRHLAAMDGTRPGEIVRQLGVEEFEDRRIGTLSRGMQQRLGLAIALLAERDLVVLDEPTEGLDPVWRVRLRDIIGALRDRGTTVVLASHDLGEVERVADRAVLLEAGRVRSTLPVRDVVDSTDYVIRTASEPAAISTAFPHARLLHDGQWNVTVSGPAELSERLAALLALGVVVSAVEPRRASLEQRVHEEMEST